MPLVHCHLAATWSTTNPSALTLDPSTNKRRQRRVDKDKKKSNSKRYSFDYKIGGYIMKRIFYPTKLGHVWDTSLSGSLIIFKNVSISDVSKLQTTYTFSLTTIRCALLGGVECHSHPVDKNLISYVFLVSLFGTIGTFDTIETEQPLSIHVHSREMLLYSSV